MDGINRYFLLRCPDAFISPHMAWQSKMAEEALEMTAVEAVIRVIKGEKPINVVNSPIKKGI